MKLLDLRLKNIGPFLDDTIEFATFENSKKQITIITGENGTGKTIILDAVRKMLLGNYGTNIRNIGRIEAIQINLNLILENNLKKLISKKENYGLEVKSGVSINIENPDQSLKNDSPVQFEQKFSSAKYSKNNLWIVNYWTSQNDNDTFQIPNVGKIIPENYLLDSLSGIQKNKKTTETITFFDYYRSSDREIERKEGEFLFRKVKDIFKISLVEGELVFVDRSTMLPIININGNEISLETLSSGNLYLIQRMLGLLSQMYSVYKLNDLALEDMLKTPGVLLIDEAENHLHPKWQKTFLNSILEIFPNLQIIATTHSPFIVGSVDGAKVYVCKSKENHSVIEDETSEYSNKPIDEILVSEVFGGTSPFANEKIVELLEQRKKAIKSRDKNLENKIEDELKQINPQYFSYLELDNLIKSISK